MGIITTKNIIFFLIILSCSISLWADDDEETPVPQNLPQYFNNSVLNQTSATSFAAQAAVTAGAAQACGVDTREYLRRINAVLYKMTFGSADKVLGGANFQQTMQEAQRYQMNNIPIPCEQIIANFYRLPIMQDNFQHAIVEQATPNTGQTAAPPTLRAPNPEPPPSPYIKDLPNINALAPAGVPPPPVQPPDHSAPNILFHSPAIAPTVDITRPLPNINDIAPNPWLNQNPPVPLSNPFAGKTPLPPGPNPPIPPRPLPPGVNPP